MSAVTTPQLSPTAEATRQRLLGDLTPQDRRVELAGIPTAVLSAGAGSPIVLLHGPGEFSDRFARIIPGLAAEHRVIAPDLPGHGRSGTPADGLDTNRVVSWLDALIAECCEQPPILMGHILGGSVALRYAAARPGRLTRIVAVDSLGLAKFRPSPRFAIGLLGFIARPTPRSHQRFMRQCLADDQALQEELGEQWDALRDYSLDRAADPGVRAAMKFFMSELGTPPIPAEQLKAIDAPVTLVWGRKDRANKIDKAEAAAARYGWPLHIIDDCADDPPMEQPEALVNAVLAG